MGNLLENRFNQVITVHGNTAEYKVKDGIDQGDIISPLLWRIFYEPLICRIANSKLEYVMSEKWVGNLHSGVRNRLKLRVSVAIYVDDTNWFASNRENMEKILKIANEFYCMNDIAINKSKSHLIAINVEESERTRRVKMGDTCG
ncbi:hypothetical protein Glove_162g73 [Diversispora epigaea]|uniref:Reverse transcriptase domain-containing protein n=1 Tax=Diversispora epigaea TaxID=1348612 RepID=A0A397IUY4_9GLOM|nr:hypothetical protein Glove_162g73 [Diversispora epigaea]